MTAPIINSNPPQPTATRSAHSTTETRPYVVTLNGGGHIGSCAALAVLDAERHNPAANITTLTDALWWTLTTITTVGYGDLYPTTAEGRLVAGALMIGGIALLGVVTGMVASWFVEKINGLELSIEDATQRELRAVHAELAALRGRLDAGPQQHDGASPPGRVREPTGSPFPAR